MKTDETGTEYFDKESLLYGGKKDYGKGLMLHSVGGPQPRASVFINNWNRADFDSACVHGFIDGTDGVVYQTLPWNHRGWHCASGSNGSGNNTHIGVEMCEPACIKYTAGSSFNCSDMVTARACVKRTYETAVELFAMLCKEYGLDPSADGVVISHAEGHARGIASNHGDPKHLWNGLGMSYTMNGFRKDVKAAMGTGSSGGDVEKKYYRVRKSWADAASQKGAFTVLENAKTCADESPGYVVFDWGGNAIYTAADTSGVTDADCPFMIRVKTADLNIRKGAGTNTAKTGKYTGIGTFTIVQVRSGKGSDAGWGKLKSDAGWIALDFCERV